MVEIDIVGNLNFNGNKVVFRSEKVSLGGVDIKDVDIFESAFRAKEVSLRDLSLHKLSLAGGYMLESVKLEDCRDIGINIKNVNPYIPIEFKNVGGCRKGSIHININDVKDKDAKISVRDFKAIAAEYPNISKWAGIGLI